MQKAQILQVGIFKSSVKLKEPFIISLGKLEYAENIIVEILDSSGRKGYGEGSPFRSIHGETSDTCFSVGIEFGKLLKGQNPLLICECSALMDSYIFGNTSIKSAFNIALHDLAAQHAGLPLYKFLGGTENKNLFTDYTVSLANSEKMVADAEKIVSAGFPVIKVKLGDSMEKDFDRIKAIRDRVANEIPLRIDANQGWSFSDAAGILPKLEPFNIQHCEEPISRKDYLLLKDLRNLSNIPIMSDESCFDHQDAQKLVSLKACDSFNVKLGKSAGISTAMKIIRIAESNNMPLQIGGFLESRLGFTAAAHLAMACKETPYIDFDTPLMFSQDFVSGGIQYSDKGMIRIQDEPGLGAYFDEKYLRNLDSFVV
ncbi:MAG TPA: dipeptide epimerase [Bacteroidia bacterium]|nr:dipeptide epimerase [Bacteroidia bacterium]